MKHITTFILLFCSTMMFSQIIYVSPTGSGNGMSWDTPTALQNALTISDSGTQLWLLKGTYTPTSCITCSDSFKMVSFNIPNGVKLYGGFIGTETEIAQRDFQNNPTILSGDIDGDDTYTNNSYSVITTIQVDSTTIVNGCTITMGNPTDNSTGYGDKTNSGGGWYNDASGTGNISSPIIQNCIFKNNKASAEGGAFFNNATNGGFSETKIENSQFENNSTIVGGGAIYDRCDQNGISKINISNCTFINNQTQGDGGAITISAQINGNANPILQYCSFTGNSAISKGGAIDHIGRQGNIFTHILNCNFENNQGGLGGAVMNDGRNGIVNGNLKNCNFTGNLATGAGAALYNTGEAEGHSSPTVYNCNFINNHSNGSGGCIFNNAILGTCNPVYTNCTMAHNVADDYGAGMYNIGKSGECNPIITNCLFYDNSAYSAGGMYNLGSVNGDCSPIITNCTFYGNTAIIGGGIYCNATDSLGHSSAKITNCIIWGNTAPTGRVMRNIYGTPVIKNTLIDVDLCEELNSGAGADVNCEESVIFNQDPLFVSSANNEFHLIAGSPAIDTGNNITINSLGILVDRDSLPRIFNEKIDLGCYENNSNIYIAPSVIAHPNNDEVCVGQDAFFTILASGTPPLTYQWYKDNVPIPSATNKSLLIQNTTIVDMANYNCVILGSNGDSDTSNIAELIINENKLVSVQLEASSTAICNGDTVTITITAENKGTSPYYEWKLNGQNIQTGNAEVLESNELQVGDSIIVSLISSESCTIYNPATSNMIVMTENENSVIPSITIETDHLNICENEVLIFSSSIQNGGNNPTYKWKLNDTIIGTASTLSLENLSDLDKVSCTLISNAGCISNPLVQSNILIIHQNKTTNPTITILSNTTKVCMNEIVTIESNISEGGTNPIYQWYLNDEITNISTPVFQSSTLQNGDKVYCQLKSNNPCTSNNLVASNIIQLEITETVTPDIVINSNRTIACDGEEVTVTAQITHGGNEPNYNWYINNISQTENTSTLSFSNLPNNSVVYCKLTSSLTCVKEETIKSNTLTLKSYGNVVPSINISRSDALICEGSPITFSATVYNEGDKPIFNWYKNSELILNENDKNYTTTNIKSGEIISCGLISSHSCVNHPEIISNNMSVEVVSSATPEISLKKRKNYCENSTIEIHTNIQNGGDNPKYKWILNDVIQEETESIITIDSIKKTDKIYAILTSDFSCATSSIATSSTLNFEDAQSFEASLEINNPVHCEQKQSIYISTAINGGDNPIFNWYKNDSLVSNKKDYSEQFINGDDIYCKMISDKYCVKEATVYSETQTIQILPSVPTSISLAFDHKKICVGDTLTVHATAINGGFDPIYKWFVNDTLIILDSNILSLTTLTTTSKIQVLLESSINCPLESSVESEILEVIVEKCPNATNNLSEQYDIQCFPNPTKDVLYISYGDYNGDVEILLFDIYGNEIYRNDERIVINSISKIGLTKYVDAVYFLVLKMDNEVISRKVFLVK